VQVFINGQDEESSRGRSRNSTRRVAGDRGHRRCNNRRGTLGPACPEADILINNNAGPSPRSFVELGHEDWLAGLEANLLAPLMLMRALLPGMRKRRFGRIINITSAMVKLPHPTTAFFFGCACRNWPPL